MPVNTREIIEAVSLITDNHNIRVTVKSSFKASALVAGFTFVGGILLGPLGIPIGASAGGVYAYKQTKGTFKSAAVVIRDELTNEQKEQFVRHLSEAFRDIRADDVVALTALLMTNQSLVISKVTQFLVNEMRMQIID